MCEGVVELGAVDLAGGGGLVVEVAQSAALGMGEGEEEGEEEEERKDLQGLGVIIIMREGC